MKMIFAIEIELIIFGIVVLVMWGVLKVLNILMRRAERKGRLELEAEKAAQEAEYRKVAEELAGKI